MLGLYSVVGCQTLEAGVLDSFLKIIVVGDWDWR